MVKILFFIEKFGGGGAEKVLRDLVNHMDQSKFDITVQSVWPYEEGKLLVPGVKYKSVYPARNKITEKLYRAEAAAGMLYQLHVKDDYDIECAFLEAGPTKVIASSTNRKAKKIAWVHCDLQKLVSDHENFVLKTKKWYRKYDSIACVSQNVKDSFDQMYGKAFQTEVVHNVVDEKTILRKAEAELPADLEKRSYTIVSVGRLSYQKGYDMLLRIQKRLLEEGTVCDLWIAGEGEARPVLEDYICKAHLESSVKLLGFRENPYALMRAADLLVCSSRWEGFSTFATEGVILGKPLVATDCTGMRELLGNSEYGLVVDCDEQALYEGIKYMLEHPEKCTEYAKKAAERGRDFTAESLTQRMESYLLDGVSVQ